MKKTARDGSLASGFQPTKTITSHVKVTAWWLVQYQDN